MEIRSWLPDGARPKPPPLWLVSDGRRTVGPVTTTALIDDAHRGLERKLHVRASHTPTWRTVGQLREVRLLDETLLERKRRLAAMHGLFGCEALLRLADRDDETLRLGLQVAAGRVEAKYGFIHRFERGRHTPVTRFAFGEGTETRIGAPIFPDDVLANVARSRLMAMGDTRSHRAFLLAGSRLAVRTRDVVGVAMVPIAARGALVAMLELGRVDRPFRTSDARPIRAIASFIGSKLACGILS